QMYVEPGYNVALGQTLLSMSTTYQGGNVPGIQLSLAAAQLKNTEETYETQRELIAKQREVANKTEDNAQELRDIAAQSKTETQEMINLNDQLLRSVNAIIEDPSTTPGAQEGAFQLKAQLLAANAQL